MLKQRGRYILQIIQAMYHLGELQLTQVSGRLSEIHPGHANI